MLKTRTLPILLTTVLAVLLAGCATKRESVQLPETDYKRVAGYVVGMEFCSAAGYMDVSLASLGVAYSEYGLKRYIYDASKFDDAKQAWRQSNFRPNKEECNSVSMEIHKQKRAIEINNKTVDANQAEVQNYLNNNKIKTTNCNKIGTQTNCTTY